MSTLSRSRIAEIDALAGTTLISAYGSEAIRPPIDLMRILTAYGLQLKEGTFEDRQIAGAFSRERNAIAVAKGDPLTRQRFTVAHEIGHYVLHQHLEDEIFYRLQADTFGDGLQEENKLREAEANAFAASLLMPSFLVFDYWVLTKDERRMARSFAVSPIAMHWRLVNLGIRDY